MILRISISVPLALLLLNATLPSVPLPKPHIKKPREQVRAPNSRASPNNNTLHKLPPEHLRRLRVRVFGM